MKMENIITVLDDCVLKRKEEEILKYNVSKDEKKLLVSMNNYKYI